MIAPAIGPWIKFLTLGFYPVTKAIEIAPKNPEDVDSKIHSVGV